jgi:hypothetical protein
MARRSITHFLLSLLLLVSQQMAMSHVITHCGDLVATAEPSQAADGALSEAIAKDQSCGHCLTFAQLASAVGDTPRASAPSTAGSQAAVPNLDPAFCARTVCAFHSRAPPSAA